MNCNKFDDVMRYDITRVTNYFLQSRGSSVERDFGLSVELEVKKFLYLIGKNKKEYGVSSLVDEYWHVFILFTEAYSDFCEFLGCGYIHHRPATSEEDELTFDGLFSNFVSDYELEFGESCPELIWHLGEVRCGAPIRCRNIVSRLQVRCGGRIQA